MTENTRVKKIIRKIEQEAAPEDRKKERKATSSKKKENLEEGIKEEYLSAKQSAYLQGWKLEARRGIIPAPSGPESGESTRVTRLSSAWGSRKEAEGIGVQEVQE